jgi:hypothetical protein
MKSLQPYILRFLSTFLLASIALFGAAVVSAWTSPTVAPPNGNVAAPINISATSQTKTGTFTASDATSYGVIGYALSTVAGAYGVYGRTWDPARGGVIGYAANGTTFGAVGMANLYSLYGNGDIRTTAGNVSLVSGNVDVGGASPEGRVIAREYCFTGPTGCVTSFGNGGGAVFGGGFTQKIHYAESGGTTTTCDVENPLAGNTCACPSGFASTLLSDIRDNVTRSITCNLNSNSTNYGQCDPGYGVMDIYQTYYCRK